ncbi:helix-turn-helix transcriptional regulator [Brevibacillus laterosporus]
MLAASRKEKGLTQEQLADLMDCEKSTISNWENGYSYPRLQDALKLSQTLGKRVEELFS